MQTSEKNCTYEHMASHFYLDDWEVRQCYRAMAGEIMLFFRGRKYTADGNILLNEAWFTNAIEDVDMAGRLITRAGEIISLGVPNTEFSKLVKDVVILHNSMTRKELLKLSKEPCWSLFRLHPHILGLWTNQAHSLENPTDIYIEVKHLLSEEQTRSLTKDERQFLRDVRTSEKSVGEWTYESNTWFYKGEFAFDDNITSTYVPPTVFQRSQARSVLAKQRKESNALVVPKDPTEVIPKDPIEIVPNDPTEVVSNDPIEAVPNDPIEVVPNDPAEVVANDSVTQTVKSTRSWFDWFSFSKR